MGVWDKVVGAVRAWDEHLRSAKVDNVLLAYQQHLAADAAGKARPPEERAAMHAHALLSMDGLRLWMVQAKRPQEEINQVALLHDTLLCMVPLSNGPANPQIDHAAVLEGHLALLRQNAVAMPGMVTNPVTHVLGAEQAVRSGEFLGKHLNVEGQRRIEGMKLPGLPMLPDVHRRGHIPGRYDTMQAMTALREEVEKSGFFPPADDVVRRHVRDVAPSVAGLMKDGDDRSL